MRLAYRKPAAGPVPLYHQVEQDLRERIANAEFGPEQSLPPEDVLAREYDVSRMTLRRALDALLESRLIVKRRGVGTFVSRASSPRRKQVTLVGRLDDAFLHMEAMSYRVLTRRRVRIEDADAAVVQALHLDAADTHVDRLEVVALTGKLPYAYSHFHFPLDIGAQLSTAALGGTVPILRVVEGTLHERVSWAEQTVEPVAASATVARCLGIAPRRPILQMRRTYYTDAGRALESVLVRYHPERYSYSAQLLAKP